MDIQRSKDVNRITVTLFVMALEAVRMENKRVGHEASLLFNPCSLTTQPFPIFSFFFINQEC